MWQAIRENPRAVFYAVLMHLVLLALLVFSLDWTPKAIKPGANIPIQAELVDSSKLKAIEEKKKAEQKKIEQEKQRKVEQEKKKKAEVEKKKKAEAEAKKKADAERKKKADLAAKQKAEEKKKADLAAKKKAEAERKRKESEMRKQMEAKARAARASQAMSKYVPRIQRKVEGNWAYPPRGPEGCNPTVRVNLAPDGKVLSAKIVKSSGDPYCDNSVEKAFLKASPIPIPLDPDLYSEFKTIDFPFRP